MNFVSDIWIRLAAFLGRDDVLAGLGDPHRGRRLTRAI
jgi:hypothetical protein